MELSANENYNFDKVAIPLTHTPLKYMAENSPPRIHGVVTTTLFKKEVFNTLNFKQGMYFEDTLLMTQIMRDNPIMLIMPAYFYTYRKNLNSTTNIPFNTKRLINLYTLVTSLGRVL